MAKQTLGQGDSNVLVRNQVIYGALPQDVIDRMGDTTLALQTTAQNVLPAINELKSNLTDLDGNFLRIKATTPSQQNVDTKIYSDTTLYGHYVVVGYSIYLASSQRYYHWVNDTSVNNIQLGVDGIYMKLAANIGNNPIYILLMKIDDLS